MTQIERLQLQGLTHQPGYKVLLDVMEMEREKSVTELLRADPADNKTIVAAHNTARAFAIFIERIQRAVNYEINEAIAEQEQAQQPEPMEEVY